MKLFGVEGRVYGYFGFGWVHVESSYVLNGQFTGSMWHTNRSRHGILNVSPPPPFFFFEEGLSYRHNTYWRDYLDTAGGAGWHDISTLSEVPRSLWLLCSFSIYVVIHVVSNI